MLLTIKKHIVFLALFLGAVVMTVAIFLLHPTFFLERKKIGNVVLFPRSGAEVSVEIAADPYQWGKGLMFRKTLGADSGMLFVFPDEEKRSFWMKDTFIPLDIIFVSRDKKVVTIHKNVMPCTTFVCPHYAPTSGAMYVLEANAGFVDVHDIKEGDGVEILRIRGKRLEVRDQREGGNF